MLLDEIVKRERSLHGARRRDLAWLDQILHPDFCEITRSGCFVTRAQTIAALIKEDPLPEMLSRHFQLVSTGEMSLILLYQSCNADGSRAALHASHWLLEGQSWRLVFHQGTPVADPDFIREPDSPLTDNKPGL
ncbi:DUF4440 domain-containing protein [Pantoea vagans]|uniref:nuclear transport factor 2 family protein n=1 Tax=Pantoea vagans TaxID=470934 RepID=UPI002253287E|nr:DUF4440 domain-containing protein [Pantoea vagans]MCX3307634.1 DUF4440 domain-containing protein [Pantoea vagans]